MRVFRALSWDAKVDIITCRRFFFGPQGGILMQFLDSAANSSLKRWVTLDT